LFGSLITAQYSGTLEKRGFVMKNILIAEELEVNETDENALWTPQSGNEAGTWRSKVKLTNNFFQECINNPVPIDLRAFKVLRGSPLAMDVYTWLTYRMSYVHSTTRPISWESLMLQFGSGYGGGTSLSPTAIKQSVLDFKKNFLRALKLVHTVYPEARVNYDENGLMLSPSPTHVSSAIPKPTQPGLF
jgi:non-specific serine/threonine protein kinase